MERLDFVGKAASRSISADGFWTENAAGRALGLVARKLCGLRIKQVYIHKKRKEDAENLWRVDAQGET